MTLTFYSWKNLYTVFDTLNIELAKLSTWFEVNKFSLTVKKTNYIIFNIRHGKSLVVHQTIQPIYLLTIVLLPELHIINS